MPCHSWKSPTQKFNNTSPNIIYFPIRLLPDNLQMMALLQNMLAQTLHPTADGQTSYNSLRFSSCTTTHIYTKLACVCCNKYSSAHQVNTSMGVSQFNRPGNRPHACCRGSVILGSDSTRLCS